MAGQGGEGSLHKPSTCQTFPPEPWDARRSGMHAVAAAPLAVDVLNQRRFMYSTSYHEGPGFRISTHKLAPRTSVNVHEYVSTARA